MAKFYYGSIDLTKVDKTKIVEGKKGGKYLPIVIWQNDDNQPDQFGYHASIQMGQTKEEREAGGKKVYLGNLKLGGQGGGTQSSGTTISQAASEAQATNDLPF